MKDSHLPPYRDPSKPCRKCGTHTQTKKILSGGKMCLQGPSDTYEPPYNPPWYKRLFGAKPTPARMRRDCEQCKAVYYELPRDVSDALAMAEYADSLMDSAMRRRPGAGASQRKKVTT